MIPSYNRSYTLGRALASVVSQTYPVLEIIVVDDCSTDDTEEVVRQFAGVSYLRMPDNGGAGRARNVGVEQAKGEWIAFLDSDDVWSCNRLEEQADYLAGQGSESPGLVCSGVTVQERSGNCRYYGFGYESPPAGWTFNEFQTYPFSTPTWLVKKTSFVAAGGFDQSLPNCEDLDLLAKLLAITPIAVVKAPLVTKFNQADSIDADLGRIELSYQVLFERHLALWKKSPAAAANSQYRLGRLRLAQGKPRGARVAFLHALRWRPMSPKYVLAWLASFFGASFMRRIARLRFWR